MEEEEPGQPKEQIRIWMDGAFDMMHYGHMNAFRQARALGTFLVVGVNDDESITACKGAPPVLNNGTLACCCRCVLAALSAWLLTLFLALFGNRGTHCFGRGLQVRRRRGAALPIHYERGVLEAHDQEGASLLDTVVARRQM